MIITRVNGGEPELFGYQLKVVLSGSMEPTFKTGSIIAVEEFTGDRPLEKGEVITFIDESESLITHRIVDIVQSGEHILYETKGDNNNAPDNQLVQSENVIAIYSGLTIPYIGYLVDITQSPLASALLLIIPGVLLMCYGIITITSIIIELERQSKQAQRQVSENN